MQRVLWSIVAAGSLVCGNVDAQRFYAHPPTVYHHYHSTTAIPRSGYGHAGYGHAGYGHVRAMGMLVAGTRFTAIQPSAVSHPTVWATSTTPINRAVSRSPTCSMIRFSLSSIVTKAVSLVAVEGGRGIIARFVACPAGSTYHGDTRVPPGSRFNGSPLLVRRTAAVGRS